MRRDTTLLRDRVHTIYLETAGLPRPNKTIKTSYCLSGFIGSRAPAGLIQRRLECTGASIAVFTYLRFLTMLRAIREKPSASRNFLQKYFKRRRDKCRRNSCFLRNTEIKFTRFVREIGSVLLGARNASIKDFFLKVELRRCD